MYSIYAGTVGTEEEKSFLSDCSTLLRAVENERQKANATGAPIDVSTLFSFSASRNFKKTLRDFAERHQRDVV